MVQGIKPISWRHREKIVNVPQQTNYKDCGIFAMIYIKCFAEWQRDGRNGNPRFDFNEIVVSQMRQLLSDGLSYAIEYLSIVL